MNAPGDPGEPREPDPRPTPHPGDEPRQVGEGAPRARDAGERAADAGPSVPPTAPGIPDTRDAAGDRDTLPDGSLSPFPRYGSSSPSPSPPPADIPPTKPDVRSPDKSRTSRRLFPRPDLPLPRTLISGLGSGPSSGRKAAPSADEPPLPVPRVDPDELARKRHAEARYASRWPRRLRRLTVVVILLLGLYAARGLWLAPLIARHIEARLSDSLGADVRIRVVEGNLFSSVRIVGVSTRREGTRTAVRRLDARAVRLHYDWRDWLNGRDDWLRTIEVEGLTLEVDLAHNVNADGSWLGRNRLPEWLPRTHVVDSVIQLRSGVDELRLERVALDYLPSRTGASRLAVLAERTSGRLGDRAIPDDQLRLRALRAGNSIQIEQLEFGLSTITRSARVTISPEDNSLRAVGQFHTDDGSIYADVTMREQLAAGSVQRVLDITRLQLDDVSIHALMNWLRLPGASADGSRGRITGEVDGRWRLDAPDRSALSMRIRCRDVELHPASIFAEPRPQSQPQRAPTTPTPRIAWPSQLLVDDAQLTLDYRDGQWVVHEAIVRTGGSMATFGGVALAAVEDRGRADDAPLWEPLINARAAHLELTVDDPATLAASVRGTGLPLEAIAGMTMDLQARIDPAGLRVGLLLEDASGRRIQMRGVLDPDENRGTVSAGANADATVRAFHTWFEQLGAGTAFLAGSVDVPDLVQMRGLMRWLGVDDDTLADVDGTLRASFEVYRSLEHPEIRVTASGGNWTFQGEALGNWSLHGRYVDPRSRTVDPTAPVRAPRFELERLVLDGAHRRTPTASIPPDRARAAGVIELDPLRVRDSYLELAIADLSRYRWLQGLIDRAGLVLRMPTGGSVEASLSGGGTGSNWRGDVWVRARNWRFDESTIDRVVVDGVLSPDRLTVYQLDATGPGGQLAAAGSVDWSGTARPRPIRLAIERMQWHRHGRRLRLQGPGVVDVEVTDDGRLASAVFAQPMTFDGPPGRVTLRGRLRLHDGESDLVVSASRLRVEELTAMIDPRADPVVRGEISRLEFAISGDASEPVWELKVHTRPLDVTGTPLARELLAFGADPTARPAPPATSGGRPASDPRVEVDALAWITGLGATMRVRDSRVRLLARSRPGANPVVGAEAVVLGTAPADPVGLIRSWLDPAEAQLDWMDRIFARGDVAMTLQLRAPDLADWRRVQPRMPLPTGSVSFDAGVSGSWRMPSITLIGGAERLDFRTVSRDAIEAVDREWQTDFTAVRDRLAAFSRVQVTVSAAFGPGAAGSERNRLPGTLGELRVNQLRIDAGESLGTIDLRGALHMRGTLVHALVGREPIDMIDARLGIRAGLPSLARLPLPTGTTASMNGEVAVDIEGVSLLHRPRWRGRARLGNVSVTAGHRVPRLESGVLELLLDGDRVTIVDGTAVLGSALARVSGSMRIAPDAERSHVDLSISGDQLLLARDDGLNLRGSVRARITGPLESMTATGTITLTRGEVREHMDVMELLQPARLPVALPGVDLPYLRDTVLDIRVESGAPTRLRTPRLTGEVLVDGRLVGTAQSPQIDGRINLHQLYVSLPAATVSLETATLVFTADQPGVPVIDIVGRSTVRGYRVDVEATGPITSPDVRLTSVPPLPADELLVLLLTGEAPTAVQSLRGIDLAGAEEVTVFVGPDLLRRVFGPDPQVRELILDRIEVDPAVDVSESGESMFVVRFALAENLVSGSDRVEVEVSRDLWDDFNTGISFTLRFR